MLASVTVALARARPIVRITSTTGPSWWAKGCSTWARTDDLAAFALAIRLGIGLPFGFLWWMRLTLPMRVRNRSFSAER